MKEYITGVVYDRVTGLPIEKARIRCYENSYESNVDGEFEIEKDFPSIQISKAGYCERQVAVLYEKNTFYLMPEAPYAYVDKEGHTPGDTIELRVHCAKSYRVSLVNFSDQPISDTNAEYPACIQDGTDQSILLSGLDWKVTSRIELPQSLRAISTLSLYRRKGGPFISYLSLFSKVHLTVIQ